MPQKTCHYTDGRPPLLSRGFFGRRRPQAPRELPPGQYYETGFPVLSFGPTPKISTDEWTFTVELKNGDSHSWDWEQMKALPQSEIHRDIHCVTKWSKLDTDWRGVDIDALLRDAGVEPDGDYMMAYCYGGYTTNLPVEDVRGGKAFLAWEYNGEPLPPEHGGPARLLVPHLYFWKSAKWVKGIRFMDRNEPGFWESNGYHMYGDPWLEQRYWGD